MLFSPLGVALAVSPQVSAVQIISPDKFDRPILDSRLQNLNCLSSGYVSSSRIHLWKRNKKFIIPNFQASSFRHEVNPKSKIQNLKSIDTVQLSEPIQTDLLNQPIEEFSFQPNPPVAPAPSSPCPPRLSKPTTESTKITQSLAIVQTPNPAGQPPSLEIQPNVPSQKPFQPQSIPLVSPQGAVAPGVTVITPSAYGGKPGSVGIGLGFQSRTRFTKLSDAVVGLRMSLGDAQKSVGLDVGVTSVSTLRRTPLEAGTISFKLNRALTDDLTVAVGVQNAINWGVTDSGTSAYGVVTKMFRLQDRVETPLSRLFVSAGIGGGQFREEFDVINNINSAGIFGSVAVQVVKPVNAIAEWTGQDLTLGLSVVPFRNVPVIITPAVTDITGNAGDGSRFILGVGYGLSF